MPAILKLFPEVYNHKKDSQKAISDRGWYPPNRKLLQHLSLQKPEEVTLPATNVEHGMSALVADKLIQARQRSNAAKIAADKRKREDDAIAENFRQSKKLTAGVLVKYGVHALDNPDFVAAVNERVAQKEQMATMKKSKDRAKLVKNVKAVETLRAVHGHERDHLFRACTFDECGTYLQYKKKAKGDPAMQKTTDEQRQRCVERIHRNSPHFTPHDSDDEADPIHAIGEDDAVMGNTEEEEQADAVLGLLEMASNRLSEPEADEDHYKYDNDDGYGMDMEDMEFATAAM